MRGSGVVRLSHAGPARRLREILRGRENGVRFGGYIEHVGVKAEMTMP